MARGRPKGSKNKPKPADASEAEMEGDEHETQAANGNGAGVGHNSKAELTDDQRQVLFFQHKKAYSAALAAKKKADADLKNAAKLAKAELGAGAVDDIKDALLLETEAGEAIIKARLERAARVARWMAVPLGMQADMFGDDRTPAVDRARAAGKAARLNGEPLKPPHSPGVPQHDAWIAGWHEGEAALIEAQRRDDEMAFGEAPAGAEEAIGDQQATYQ